jgi:hypothetical protein
MSIISDAPKYPRDLLLAIAGRAAESALDDLRLQGLQDGPLMEEFNAFLKIIDR